MIKLSVAVGRSAEARQWKNRTFVWAEFVDRLRKPQVTHERYADYMAMSKAEQGKIKDVGGYVCGYLNGGRRRLTDVMSRSALTLDLDFAPAYFWDLVTMTYECAAVLHSTHKHSTETPRFRLIIPLDREVTPDEYSAIARRVAKQLDIEYFDPTTFDVNRLMFWPSVAQDGEYVFEEQEGEPLCADRVLGSYRNWRDVSEWAFSGKEIGEIDRERKKKQEDPTTKNNVVGYFCNAYDIHQAIAEFLSDVYEPAGENRYTYVQGSTTGGLVTYDDLFAYSHHGTDPASGMTCNAFDLVRIHKFGHAETEAEKKRTYNQMADFCLTLGPVRKIAARSMVRDYDEYRERKPDFDGDPYEKRKPAPKKKPATAAGDAPEDDRDWREQLDVDRNGKLENTANNVTLILRNDPRLANRLRQNTFSEKRFIMDAFPWHAGSGSYPCLMRDVDYAGLRSYIERVYGISAPQKIDDAVQLELERNQFHPVRDYFNSLEWDGVPRIDRLLIDCFNAEDNVYTREVSRKWMVAAVNRVMDPGCKYDTVVTLVGEEGTRKSSFFRKLGRDWFTDSFTTVTGKEAFEQIQGKLVVEIAEMSAFDKAESVQIKHYITKQVDSFRPAYAREVKDFSRQCVFVATSNNRTFLRDLEGNRRFWPIDVHLKAKTGGRIDPMSDEFDALIPQLWAEAVALWRLGEPLTLSNEAELLADAEREGHVETDARRGMVEEFLNSEVPENWDEMAAEARADFIDDPESFRARTRSPMQRRTRICLAEIWCECFGKRKEDLVKRESMGLAAIMRTIPGWRLSAKTGRFKQYGKQRYYEYTG